MKSKFEIRMSKFEFVSALTLLLIFALSSPAQTIADVARREQARQRQIQHQNKGTYTNVSAAVTTAPAAKPATTAPAEAAPELKEQAPATPAGPVDNQGRDEKYWRDVFEKGRTELRRAEETVLIQEAKLKDLNTQLLRQSDIYNLENVLGPQITAAQKDLDTAKRQVEQARNKVSNLDEELRAAGGLPGWAR